MPSRKKAQGKARKAAKAKAAETTRKEDEKTRKIKAFDQWYAAQLKRLRLEDEESCMHGCDKPDYDICGFVKRYLQVVVLIPMEKCPWMVAYNIATKAYPEMMSHADNISAIDSIFVALATNCVLSGDMDLARRCASSASYFEMQGKFISDHLRLGRENLGLVTGIEKMRELGVSDEHTLVRYIQKRIPCSCLDEKYEEVKGIKKIGLCHGINCKNNGGVAERSTMMHCTRCRRAYYCSRECQEAHWPIHKTICEKMCRERKESKTNTPKYNLDKIEKEIQDMENFLTKQKQGPAPN